MVEYKAKVVLAKNVWEKINWFTNNFPTEIGALGTVSLKTYNGEKCFYVEELLFPKQEVSGASVMFTPEMWGDLVKQKGLKGLEKVAFYWHRHPGSSAHSHTDEVKTFDAFMDVNADGTSRPFFIFYQTATSSTGGFNEEARIDINKPIKATIMNVEVTVDDPEDDAIRKECEAIAKACIVEKPKPVYPVTTYNSGTYANGSRLSDYSRGNYGYNGYDEYRSQLFEDSVKGSHTVTPMKKPTYDAIILNGNVEPNHFDNDIFKGIQTAEEDRFAITYENGQVTILVGTVCDNIIKGVLSTHDHELAKATKSFQSKVLNNMVQWKLQPHGGGYQQLKEQALKLYKDYLVALDKQYVKDGVYKELSTDSKLEKITEEIAMPPTPDADDIDDCIIIEGTKEISDVIEQIEEAFFLNWLIKDVKGEVCEYEEMTPIGQIAIDKQRQSAMITGDMLIMFLQETPEELAEDIAKYQGLETKVNKGGKKNGSKK